MTTYPGHGPVRVLIVDDSLVMRNLLSRQLGADPDIEIVGTASDPYIARDVIMETTPDVMTLDIEMPRMDGVSFLQKLMAQYPIPTVMVSSLTTKGGEKTFEALAAGAVDFVAKPMSGGPEAIASLMEELKRKVKAAARVDLSRHKPMTQIQRVAPAVENRSGIKLIAIGASTGGVEALSTVIPELGLGIPPVLIAQHMPREFTPILARRLQDRSHLKVHEAKDGEPLVSGHVYIAPGGKHLTITGRAEGVGSNGLRARLDEGALVSGHRPSVDALFASVAERVGSSAIGVLLTGMGADGAEGLLSMRRAGAKTMAQDEASCVVFGMPQRAIQLGAAQEVRSLRDVPTTITRWLGDSK